MIVAMCSDAVGITMKKGIHAALRPNRAGATLGLLLIAALLLAAVPAAALNGPQTGQTGQVIGAGDGRIHIIPSLSAPSVKNAGRITIQAVVKAVDGVKKVEARIEPEAGPNSNSDVLAALRSGIIPGLPLATLDLKPAPMNLGGVNTSGTMGMWQAEWVAAGLTEGYYRVAITVTDRAGHSYTDNSLVFSDPIAGINTIGVSAPVRRVDAVNLPVGASDFYCALMDAANGYAYFGAGGCVVKVALGSGSNPPTWVGRLDLTTSGELYPYCGVIDAANGYAYFGTYAAPGRVVKVALGTGSNLPTRVGALTLATGENYLYTAVIDTANGYAYFGTGTSPGRVVKVALGNGSNPPTHVGAVTLETGENHIRTGVIDATNGYAYFGTYTYPAAGIVVKVALGSGSNAPTRVGAVTLDTDECYLTSAVIDTANGYAYFATDWSPTYVVKVALGSGSNAPTRVGAATLNAGEDGHSAVIDAANGYAYFGSGGSADGHVVKVALGEGANPPTRVDAVTLNTDEDYLSCAAVDTANGYAYFGTCYTDAGHVVKVALGTGSNAPTRAGAGTFDHERSLYTGLIDTANGYAYFGTDGAPGVVVKMALGTESTPLTRVGAMTLTTNENGLLSAVIDAANGYAYFGTDTSPGRVVKVALGAGSALPTRVGALTLEAGEDSLTSVVIDAANGYAYFGTETSPGKVVKVALGAGAALPTRVGALTLEAGEDSLKSAVIDTANGYAYFGTYTTPGIVVKVALGAGAALPTRVGAVTLDTNENQLLTGVIDAANGYAYFSTYRGLVLAGSVVKVALGTGSNPPTRVAALTMTANEASMCSAVIDTTNGYAYFASGSSVTKVALGSGSNPPTREGWAVLPEGPLRGGVIDATNAYAYFGMYECESRVVRVDLSQRSFLKCTKITMPEVGGVQSVSLYSYAAAGNVRLAIYDNSANPQLLWQSPSTANTAAGDWLTVPVSSGTPSAIVLAPGTYWLGWQVDTVTPIPSYAWVGSAGMYVPMAYGTCPASLEAGTSTEPTLADERWSTYLTYTPPPTAPSNFGATAITTNSITWTWQDNSSDETGFKVYADITLASPTTLRTTTAADVEQWQYNGLSPSQGYAFRVVATSPNGDSNLTSSYSAYTLAATPVAPVVSNPTSSTLQVAIGAGDGNSSSAYYAIQVSPAVEGNSWVQANGTLGASAVYQSAFNWGTKTVTGLADYTTYAFTVTARNGASVLTSPSPSASGTTLDATPPTGTILINDGATYTASYTVTLGLSASDSGSGVSQMRFSNNNSTWSTWEAYATTKSRTLSAGDGLKTIYVQYRDAQNNVSTETISDTITRDSTAPTGSVSVNGGATYTGTASVTLTLSASDGSGTGVAQMQFSNDYSHWSEWESYGTTKTWTLADVDGAKTVHVHYRDALNNISYTYDNITLDTARPTGTVSINGGATYATSASVNLTLSGGDGSGSGVSQMQFSNDNAVWSEWESYAVSKSWTFPAGEGVKTVYARYRDAVNNVSTATISDTVTLDQTPPVITLLGANPMDVEQDGEYVEPGATAVDAISGDCTLLLVIDASAVNTATAGEYVVTYDVSDAAGNPSHAERVVRVATQVPLAPSIALALGAILAGLGIHAVSRGWGRQGKDRSSSPA